MSRSIKKDYPKKFDSRRFDHSCRSHGGCSYCSDNRQFFDKKARARLTNQENEFFGYWNYPDAGDEVFDEADRLMIKFGFDPNNVDDMRDSGLWS